MCQNKLDSKKIYPRERIVKEDIDQKGTACRNILLQLNIIQVSLTDTTLVKVTPEASKLVLA